MAYLKSRSILTRESDAIDAAVVDNEPLDNVDSEGKIEVTDVIAAEEAEAEVAEINNAIEAENEVIEENQEIAEELEEVAEANETLINEAPEQVTPEQVVAAEQAFVHALGRARLNRGEMLKIRQYSKVSHESMVNSPLQSLRVTQEGIKDFLRNLWDQIKTLIGKVVGTIQKLFQKAKLLFVNLEKKAKALDAKAKYLKGNVTLEPEEAEEVRLMAPFFTAFGKKADDCFEAMKFATFGSIVNKIASGSASIPKDENGIVQFLTGVVSGFKTKLGANIQTVVDLQTFMNTRYDDGVTIGEYKSGDKTGVFPFITDGKKLWVFVIGKSKEYSSDETNNRFDINVVTVDYSDLGEKAKPGNSIYDLDWVKAYTPLLVKGAKDLDKVVDSIRKSEEVLKKIADSAIKSVDKSDADSYEKVNSKIIARTVQLCATKVSIGAVNSYINGCKNLMSQVSYIISKANKDAGKREKNTLNIDETK